MKEKVKLSERGLTPQDLGHMLIYKSMLKDIAVKIVYSFDDNKRLRSAGYIVDKPIGGVKHIKDYAMYLHGEPSNQSSSLGYGWVTEPSLIYLQMNERVKVLSPYLTTSGALSHLTDTQPEDAKVLSV